MKNVKKFKNFVMIFTVFILVASQINASASITYRVQYKGKQYRYTGKSYQVYYNNSLVSSASRPAILVNQNIMIPYYYTLVQRGPKLTKSYNTATRTLTLTYGTKKVELTVNSNYYYANGVKKTLRTAPFTAMLSGSNCIMIPAKAILPELGFGYTYNKSQAAVYITGSAASSSTGTSSGQTNQTTSTSGSTASTTTTSATSTGSSGSSTSLSSKYTNLVATSFNGMTTSEFINLLGPIAKENNRQTGILASVTLAQAILESGWGRSTLAQRGNNIFGMKAVISGNNWAGSTWDGKSVIKIKTGEEYGGRRVTITAKFRKYNTVYESIQDHSAYLLNAKNGSKLRYAGLSKTTSYARQIGIIKKGGYATSSSYVNSLIRLIKKYKLTKFDVK